MTQQNIQAATERAACTARRVEVSDDEHAGLELGISPRGIRTWSLRIRDPSGRLRRFRVGGFPDLTPAAARKAARSLRIHIEEGSDPIAEKRARRAKGAALRADIGTLGALVDQYQAEGSPPKTWFTGAGRKRVERVFRELMPRALNDMKSSDIVRATDAYDGSRLAAQNAIRALRPVLSWAVRRDYAPAGLLLVSPGGGVPSRDRVLSRDELRRVIPVLRHYSSAHGPAMLFMLLTLARREEAAGATWGEIDLGEATWTIPSVRQKKTKRSHVSHAPIVVPLSRQAIRLLRWVKPDAAADDMLVFPSRTGTLLGNWNRIQQNIFRGTDSAGWHRHDLRRTGATLMGESGIPPHVVEAALNHTAIHSPLAARYNHSKYRADVTEALEGLGRLCDTIAIQHDFRPDMYGEPELVQIDPYERPAPWCRKGSEYTSTPWESEKFPLPSVATRILPSA